MTNTNQTPSPIKTWFITGASSGIGHALTKAALGRGDNVTAIARNVGALDELADVSGDRLLVFFADVREEASVKAAVAATIERFHTLDVVVNAAAVGIFAGVEELSDAQWKQIFDTNFFGTMNVLRATLPVLREKKSGHVLLGSAHYGQSGHAGVGSVAATKHALEGVTDSLRDELTPLGVKVTTFEPGFTATAFLQRLTMGANPISDYDQTVRATLQAVGEMTADQFNSADAVAAALIAAVDAEEAPLRLAIGGVSFHMIKDALAARQQNLDEWSAVSLAADTFTN